MKLSKEAKVWHHVEPIGTTVAFFFGITSVLGIWAILVGGF